jgi:organic hydroperoxide reductase OsmC/OhrA
LEHIAIVEWKRDRAKFIDNRYSREHVWKFDGGAEIPASSSPHVVPEPYSNAACVDPEEAFIASLSSCHMLWFLSIAAKKHFLVESYSDRAVGIMETSERGRMAISKVHLYPQIEFRGDNLPTEREIETMHEEAHHSCFLANSVKTEIVVNLILPHEL